MYCFCVWFAVRHTEHRPPFPPASYITSAFKQPCRRRHRQPRRTDDDYRWTHGRRRTGLVGPYARRSCCGGPAGTRPKRDVDIGPFRLDETHSSSLVRTNRRRLARPTSLWPPPPPPRVTGTCTVRSRWIFAVDFWLYCNQCAVSPFVYMFF